MDIDVVKVGVLMVKKKFVPKGGEREVRGGKEEEGNLGFEGI